MNYLFDNSEQSRILGAHAQNVPMNYSVQILVGELIWRSMINY